MNAARGAIDLATFVAAAVVPGEARRAAQTAFVDTVGVMLAGAVEPPARMVQNLRARGRCERRAHSRHGNDHVDW